jgi:L-alanine-DL-glutamate epimerase-like enolase superfamily enzyme
MKRVEHRQMKDRNRKSTSARPAISRRSFLKATTLSPLLLSLASPRVERVYGVTPKSSDIRIDEVTFTYEDIPYRTPYKFGGREIDRVTLLNVHCVVHTASGRTARGFGSMPLVSAWGFPSKHMSFDVTLGAMKAHAERIRKITADFTEPAHPIDINVALEPEYLKAANDVTRDLHLTEPIPKLCTLLTASPFDAALHDAFGKIHGRSSYDTYGREFMRYDLSHYLGPDFKGEYADRYVLKAPSPRLALLHSVGESDPIDESDVKERINDGLPMSLRGWILFNGLTHIKIKLTGNNVEWDLDRILSIDRTTRETEKTRGVRDWTYSLDFNEQCPNVGTLLDFLRRVKEKSPSGYAKIQYIEQPTKRDLEKDRENVMFEAAKFRPVVIDESLTGVDMLLLARQMGYSGAALKTCKGQSQSILVAAACQKFKMFMVVQDLTCPGASLVHSVGLAAHIPGITAVESNARHFVPAGNKGWETRFPGIFTVTDGTFRTGDLTKPGLGVVD